MMTNHFFNGIKHAIGFIFVFLLIGSFVYAVGFHSANEILTGVFQGDYTFNGNVNLTENATLYFSDGSSLTSGQTGKILQVETFVSPTIYSTTSSSFVDSGVELNITPIRNDSTILIMFDFAWTMNPVTSGAQIKIVRDNLDIRSASLYSGVSAQIHHLESFKATDSNLNASQEYTYKIQHRLTTGTALGLEKTSFILMEIAN